jgi:hypothetical protein
MIDANLLKSLGWNDDLIDEVNRVARNIDTPPAPVEIPFPGRIVLTSDAGSVLHFRESPESPSLSR